jgi:hypothetical protein
MLETIAPGTPVSAGTECVGYVRSVYAVAGTRAASTIVVLWTARAEEVGIPATEVESIDDDGVHLMAAEAKNYADLVPFSEASYPTLERISPA